MASNVIHLPRPEGLRENDDSLGWYLRVGWNQHRAVMDVMAEGEDGFIGVVIDAQSVERHKELRIETAKKGIDLILDTKTHASATIGGHNASLAKLPWGLERHHKVDDFIGAAGMGRAQQMVEFAVEAQFNQILGPTHLLNSANDQWLRADIEMMKFVQDELEELPQDVELIYPLALPMKVMRDTHQFRAIIGAISDAPFDAIWLRIENFGSDATGEKTKAYIAACEELKSFGVPLVADHVGGLVGTSLLAFGAVGGIAHGIAEKEHFRIAGWKKPQQESNVWTQPTRVYLPELDMLLKPNEAQGLFSSSTRVKSRYGCKDTHCCPNGIKDMVARPVRHFIHQRSEEVKSLIHMPPSIRPQRFLDERIRKVSDDIAAAASLKSVSDVFKGKVEKKQSVVSKFRRTMSHLVDNYKEHAIEAPKKPLSSTARKQKK